MACFVGIQNPSHFEIPYYYTWSFSFTVQYKMSENHPTGEEKDVNVTNNVSLRELLPNIATPECFSLSKKPRMISDDELIIGNNGKHVSKLTFKPFIVSSPAPCWKKVDTAKTEIDIKDNCVERAEVDSEESSKDDQVGCSTSDGEECAVENLNRVSQVDNTDESHPTGKHITTLSFDPSKAPQTFNCNECDKTFNTDNLLQIHRKCHMNIHNQARSSISDFNGNFALQSEVDSETQKEYPYKCGECNKSFAAKGSLRDHCTVHTGERPYQCSHCDKRFRLLSNYYKHLRRMHK